MISHWREFLINRGARIADDAVIGFGDTPAEPLPDPDEAVLADLSYLQPVEVTGSDAVSFLHGQLASDVEGQAPGSVRFSAWCDARGRVLAVLLLARLPERLVLFVPAALQPDFQERLQRFRLRADVRFQDRSDEWAGLGVSGLAHEPPPDLPADPGRAGEQPGLITLRLPDPVSDRFIAIGAPDTLSRLWAALETIARPAGSAAWRLLDCARGIPWLDPLSRERYLPQELGLERLGALSFSKGCFPGQEIIARVHYRGKAKRRLAIIAASTAEPPAPGTELVHGGTPAGHVLFAQPREPGNVLGLAVVGAEYQAGVELQLGDARGAPVQLREIAQASTA